MICAREKKDTRMNKRHTQVYVGIRHEKTKKDIFGNDMCEREEKIHE